MKKRNHPNKIFILFLSLIAPIAFSLRVVAMPEIGMGVADEDAHHQLVRVGQNSVLEGEEAAKKAGARGASTAVLRTMEDDDSGLPVQNEDKFFSEAESKEASAVGLARQEEPGSDLSSQLREAIVRLEERKRLLAQAVDAKGLSATEIINTKEFNEYAHSEYEVETINRIIASKKGYYVSKQLIEYDYSVESAFDFWKKEGQDLDESGLKKELEIILPMHPDSSKFQTIFTLTYRNAIESTRDFEQSPNAESGIKFFQNSMEFRNMQEDVTSLIDTTYGDNTLEIVRSMRRDMEEQLGVSVGMMRRVPQLASRVVANAISSSVVTPNASRILPSHSTSSVPLLHLPDYNVVPNENTQSVTVRECLSNDDPDLATKYSKKSILCEMFISFHRKSGSISNYKVKNREVSLFYFEGNGKDESGFIGSEEEIQHAVSEEWIEEID